MKIRGAFSITCLLSTLLLSSWVGAVNIYVDDTAPGGNNGTTWFNAYRYLQDALSAAAPGDIIRVAQGTYYPHLTTPPSVQDRFATFALINNVQLRGGYAGWGMPNPDLRDIQQYLSILSGDLDANDVVLDPNDWQDRQLLIHATRQENAYSVVTSTENDASAVLDGFVVTGGNANGPSDFPYAYIRGGGVFVYKGSPTIRRCTVMGNSAEDAGGAMCNYTADTTITDCNFVSNFCDNHGAGIYNTTAEPNIIDCEFQWNRADRNAEGGGIYNESSNPLIEGCGFHENYGGFYGGAIMSVRSDPVVRDCLFVDNTSRTEGGAVRNSTMTYPLFEDCEFYGNSTTGRGGAMVNYFSTPTLISCTFNGNMADNGGAVDSRSSEPTVVNCVFSGNEADEKGGAMSFYDTSVSIINCSLYGNNASDGDGLACFNHTVGPAAISYVQIDNSILWHDSNSIYEDDGSLVVVSYSDVAGGYPGTGNIAVNPFFVHPLGGDGMVGTDDDNLRLLPGSPCIDAADNFSVPVDIVADRDGNDRFYDDPNTPDTGQGTPPIVDMGAYEFGAGPGGGGGGGGINHPPVANAGPDQEVSAGINGQALVYLDGSGSFDPDADPLFYSWNGVIDGNAFQLNTVNPAILLPVGVHTITLIVGDGQLISFPDQVQITVTANAVQGQVGWFYPNPVQRGVCGGSQVFVMIYLFQINPGDVDLGQPMVLTPGNLLSTSQYVVNYGNGIIAVMASFNKTQLTNAIPTNGLVDLTFTGSLMGGQQYTAMDQISITNCP